MVAGERSNQTPYFVRGGFAKIEVWWREVRFHHDSRLDSLAYRMVLEGNDGLNRSFSGRV